MFSTCICKDSDFINLSILLRYKTLYFEIFDFFLIIYFFNFILHYYFKFIDNQNNDFFCITILLIIFVF